MSCMSISQVHNHVRYNRQLGTKPFFHEYLGGYDTISGDYQTNSCIHPCSTLGALVKSTDEITRNFKEIMKEEFERTLAQASVLERGVSLPLDERTKTVERATLMQQLDASEEQMKTEMRKAGETFHLELAELLIELSPKAAEMLDSGIAIKDIANMWREGLAERNRQGAEAHQER